MSRQARARSSLALALVVLLSTALWIVGRGVAHAGDSKDVSIADAAIPAKKAGARTTVLPLPTDFKVKLLSAGLSPRALAAAGVSQSSILATLQAAADQMNAAPIALDNAEETRATARNAADALARKIQSGKASQEEIASYPAAAIALAAAEAACQSVLDNYFSSAISNLPVGQRTALTNIRANRAWGLAEEYLVVNRSEAEWIALRDALANERIAVDLPETLSPSAQALLSTVRATPAVAASLTASQTNLPAISTAWNTAQGE